MYTEGAWQMMKKTFLFTEKTVKWLMAGNMEREKVTKHKVFNVGYTRPGEIYNKISPGLL